MKKSVGFIVWHVPSDEPWDGIRRFKVWCSHKMAMAHGGNCKGCEVREVFVEVPVG
jgi:hypothetical protein